MEPKKFRILLYNVGYATALDGSLRNYFLRFYRYLYTPGRIIRIVRQAIYQLLEREKPDVCCFIEVHRKTRTALEPRVYAVHDIDNKYGRRSVLRRLPFFRDNCNGFFAQEGVQFKKYYFKNGVKKLIYEIQLREDTSLLMVHFSLEKRVRRKQCEELKEMIEHRDNVILCGDFNIFKGRAELEALAESCGLQIVNSPTEATFPAIHPTKALDLFLCPKSMNNLSVRVLNDVRVSDHLPVLLEMEL